MTNLYDMPPALARQLAATLSTEHHELARTLVENQKRNSPRP